MHCPKTKLNNRTYSLKLLEYSFINTHVFEFAAYLVDYVVNDTTIYMGLSRN